MADDEQPTSGHVQTATIPVTMPKPLLGAVDEVWQDRLYESRDDLMCAGIRAAVRSQAWVETGNDAGESIESLIAQGLSPVKAVDYYYTERRGYTQKQWANIRDVSPQAVSENVATADRFMRRDR